MLVEEERLISLFDVPVLLPQTTVPAGASMAVATIQLAGKATLDYRWMQLCVASASNTSVTDSDNDADDVDVTPINVVNLNFPTGSVASLFLIKDWSPTAEPWTQTVVDTLIAPANVADAQRAAFPLIVARDLTAPLKITELGNYTVVVLNNTTNRDLTITVTGAVTIDSDPVE
jgi:hypothetical protein